MPPGLLVPRCCWRCWCCCLRPWDDRQFHCFQYLLSHRLHHCRGQPGSQVPLTMLGVVGFTGATCEGQGARIMVISLPEEMGLQGLLLLLPSYLWIWVLESCALPPLLLWGSLGLPWLRARISGTTSTVPSPPLIYTHLTHNSKSWQFYYSRISGIHLPFPIPTGNALIQENLFAATLSLLVFLMALLLLWYIFFQAWVFPLYFIMSGPISLPSSHSFWNFYISFRRFLSLHSTLWLRTDTLDMNSGIILFSFSWH